MSSYLKIRQMAVRHRRVLGIVGILVLVGIFVLIEKPVWTVIWELFVDRVPDCYETRHGYTVCDGDTTHWFVGLVAFFVVVVVHVVAFFCFAVMGFMIRGLEKLHDEIVHLLRDRKDCGRPLLRIAIALKLVERDITRRTWMREDFIKSFKNEAADLPEFAKADFERVYNEGVSRHDTLLSGLVAQQEELNRKFASWEQEATVRGELLFEILEISILYEKSKIPDARKTFLPKLDELVEKFLARPDPT